MQEINTNPQYGVWVPFVGVRHKEPYDVLLKDGRIINSLYPNGVMWGPCACMKSLSEWVDSYPIHDDNIVALRMLTDEEIQTRDLIHTTGPARTARLISHQAFEQDVYVLHRSEMLDGNKVRNLVNVLTELAKTHHLSGSLREVISKRVKDAVSKFRIS